MRSVSARGVRVSDEAAGRVGSARAVVRSLQEENDSLRDQLLRTQQERDQLRRRLDATIAQHAFPMTAAVVSSQRRDANTIEALQRRCEQLANRLLACVRDHQLSQSSEVYFLLRTQQQERRYVCEALEELITSLQDAGDHPRSGPQPSSEKTVLAGSVSVLIQELSDALHARTAHHKVEKARARLSLEHSSAVVHEMQGVISEATRSVYSSWAALSTAGETPKQKQLRWASGSPFQQRTPSASSTPVAAAAPAAAATTTAACDSFLSRGGDRTASVVDASMVEDMGWTCDVLKACCKGLRDVEDLTHAALEELSMKPTDQLGAVSSGGRRRAQTSLPALAQVSAETQQLLDSILGDIQTVVARSAKHQEKIARRLSDELLHSYETSKQYQERIQLLESENTRLVATASIATAAVVTSEQQHHVGSMEDRTGHTIQNNSSQPVPTAEEETTPERLPYTGQHQQQQQQQQRRVTPGDDDDAMKSLFTEEESLTPEMSTIAGEALPSWRTTVQANHPHSRQYYRQQREAAAAAAAVVVAPPPPVPQPMVRHDDCTEPFRDREQSCPQEEDEVSAHRQAIIRGRLRSPSKASVVDSYYQGNISPDTWLGRPSNLLSPSRAD